MQRKSIIHFPLFLSLVIYCVMAPTLFIPIPPVSANPSVPQVPNLGTTYISKPVSPICINESQIPVGYSWTYVYNLKANHTYHAYCYGEWIKTYTDYTDPPLTDYDIFVYDPFGNLVSYHTEAAGTYEHLGDTVEQPFFTPKHSGDYSFLIINDPKESGAAENATLMLIEHIECNRWYQRFMEGKINDVPVENTSWAYEFNTASRQIQILVRVPETLDMYEARLYPMANPFRNVSVSLNGVPLAWEPGLYGVCLGIYGGYNLDSRGFRNSDAVASCEYPGEDMLIDYAPSQDGNILYHLVFIAESEYGNVDFMVKTDFGSPKVEIKEPIENAETNEEVVIFAQVSDDQPIEEVLLHYTNDDWTTENSITMSLLLDKTYVGTIPGQPAGKTIKYKVSARDYAGNYDEDNGSYSVKSPTSIVFSLSSSTIHGGESITVTGSISQGGTPVTLRYACGETTIVRTTTAHSNGSFNDAFAPTMAGLWTVLASWNGNATCFGTSTGEQSFTVERTSLSITYTLSRDAITIGESVTIDGSVTPAVQNIQVLVTFTYEEVNDVWQTFTQADGTFSLTFEPDSVGSWQVTTRTLGDNLRYNPSNGDLKSFQVNDTWINQNKIFLIIGVGVSIFGGFILIVIIKARS